MTGVSPAGDGYELSLTGGETLLARQVVVAVGVEHFAYLPEQLAALPAGVCTHSSAHTDLAAFAGQRVTVVGPSRPPSRRPCCTSTGPRSRSSCARST